MLKNISAIDLYTDSFIKASPNDSASKLVGLFLKFNQNHALVFDGNRYIGTTTKEGFLKKRIDFSATKLGSFIKNKPLLFGDDSVSKIAELMFSTEARLLPVFEKKSFLGAVFARDVINQINYFKELKSLPVSRVASLSPLLVLESVSLGRAISLMQDKKINRLPLVSSSGELTGLFSFSDFLQNVALHSLQKPRGQFKRKGEMLKKTSILKSPVKMFSSNNPFCVKPEDSLEMALKKMQQKNISGLLLVEKQKPTGIITTRDLLQVLTSFKQDSRNIRLVNRPVLDEIDDLVFSKTINEYFDKLNRFFNGASVSIHFKDYKKTGLRKKHLIRARLTAPGVSLFSKAESWDLLSALQHCLKALQSEARRKRK